MDEMEIVRRLYHMFYLLRREGFRCCGDHPMGGRDLMMLDTIMHGGNLVKMNDISAYFHITPAAVSQMIRTFEKKNWVERVVLEKDRRSVYVRVSEEGQKLIEQNEKDVTERLVEFIELLGEEDAKALIRIVEKAQVHAKKHREDECRKKGERIC